MNLANTTVDVGCPSVEVTRRRYTRSELFNFAKSMKGECLALSDLNRFETADWTKYNLDPIETDLDCENRHTSMKSLTNFGRQRSELYHEPSSLDFSRSRYSINNNNIESRKNQTAYKTRNLSRMTSSPTIRYTRQPEAPVEGISSQAHAKYARLIENLSCGPTNSSGSAAGGAGDHQDSARSSTSMMRQSLYRTTSHNSWLSNDYQRPSVERPTQLFGPLRREHRHEPRHERRNSEEPLSLPYTTTNTGMREHLSGEKWAPSSKVNLLMDDLSSSPIKRIASSAERPPADSVEDDDFDITSLLSITVLSDIKTMRHDSHSRPTNNFSLRQQPVRGRQHHEAAPMRLLTRARTATDFTYSGRQGRDRQIGRATGSSQIYSNDDHASGAESLDLNYNLHDQGHRNSIEGRELTGNHYGPKWAASDSSGGHKKPVDESVVKIIETFKAQVMARAKETDSRLNDHAGPDRKTDWFKKGPNEPVAKANSTVRDGSALPETDLPDFERGSKQTNLHQNSELSTGPEESASKMVPNSNEEPLVIRSLGSKDEAKQESDCTTVLKQTSNIPRLISLHKPKSSVPIEKTLKDKKSTPAIVTKAAVITQMATTVGVKTKVEPKASSSGGIAGERKSSAKFISQYKILRGKSLADEVRETS